MKIEGIPDGWELVRIGRPKANETVIADDGQLHTFRSNTATSVNFPIIRRIPPPLSIPPKVFDDGWLFQDGLHVYWSPQKPKWLGRDSQLWTESSTGLCYQIPSCLKCTWFDDLPYDERICRVTWEHGSECEQT